jgi:glutamine amidotransferase
MCIAIALPAGKVIPMSHLIESQRANPDGCGLAWVENGQVQIYKSMKFEDWKTKYLEVIDRCGNINMLIHFRITSRGKTSEDMCHPFMVGDDMAIIHNGTISNITAAETANGDSDTKVLAEKIMRDLPVGWEHNQSVIRLLEDFIGWSKICILTSNDEIIFLNESKGFWDNGIWYSNKTYISYVRPVTSTPANNVSYYAGNSSNQSTRFWGDSCDGCFVDFPYEKMTAFGGDLYCDACLVKAKRDAEERDAKRNPSNVVALAPIIHRPCAGCRDLTSKDEMWHVELTFQTDLQEHPEQLEFFQKNFIAESPKWGNVGDGWFCGDCYLNLLIEDTCPSCVIEVNVEQQPAIYNYDKVANKTEE